MKQLCHCIKYSFIEPCWTKILHIFINCDASIFGLGFLITILGLVIFVPSLLIFALPWFLVKVLFTFVMILFVSILATMFVIIVASIVPTGLGNFIHISLCNLINGGWDPESIAMIKRIRLQHFLGASFHHLKNSFQSVRFISCISVFSHHHLVEFRF